MVSYPVIGRVSYDSGGGKQEHKHNGVEGPKRRNGAGREEQGIAGQKWQNNKTGFAKDNGEQDDIREDPVFAGNGRQMLVEMEKDINNF